MMWTEASRRESKQRGRQGWGRMERARARAANPRGIRTQCTRLQPDCSSVLGRRHCSCSSASTVLPRLVAGRVCDPLLWRFPAHLCASSMHRVSPFPVARSATCSLAWWLRMRWFSELPEQSASWTGRRCSDRSCASLCAPAMAHTCVLLRAQSCVQTGPIRATPLAYSSSSAEGWPCTPVSLFEVHSAGGGSCAFLKASSEL